MIVERVDSPSNKFRVYDAELAKTDAVQKRVLELYTLQHTNQTVAYNVEQRAKWLKFDHAEWDVMTALDQLNTLVDESDPDVDFSNDNHAYQSAEAARLKHPDKPWFHLTCLIHDMGKVMTLWESHPQWATVGDTFVVGCAPGDNVVHRHTFEKNPDLQDGRYNTKYGPYKANCGFDNVTMSWGHDEYLYQVLRNHKKCKLPEEALYMIRYHSFYPWHSNGDYSHLANEKDKKMLPMVDMFNEFDLYSKCDTMPNITELRPYYQSLVDDWCPGLIKF